MFRRLSDALGLGVLVSYASLARLFPGGYVENDLWLGQGRDIVRVMTSFQLLAAAGGVAWRWLHRQAPAAGGLLSYSFWGVGGSEALWLGFLVSSIGWPLSLWFVGSVRDISLAQALLVCAPLWSAGVFSLLMMGGTAEAENVTAAKFLSCWALTNVVAIFDATCWTAVLITKTAHGRGE